MIDFLTIFCLCACVWILTSWLGTVSRRLQTLSEIVALQGKAHQSTLDLLKEMNKESST